MQTQVGNQGKSLPIPLGNPSQPSQQMLLTHPMHNTIASPGVQSSGNLVPTMPSIIGLTENSGMNNIGKSCNLQNVSGMSQNLIGNSVGQRGATNFYANSHRQIQGRQHLQQNQQQAQNQQQFVFQQQLQQSVMKKRGRGNIQTPLSQQQQQNLLQQQQQQQNLLQPIQMQSSQQSVVQTSSGIQQAQSSMIQSATQSGLLQNQQSSALQLRLLQQHSQSVLRQQQQQSQHSLHQQQTTSMAQQSMLSAQQKQQLIGKQTDERNLQQNQLLGQPNSGMEMQQQQQQKWVGQQNNLSSIHQQQQVISFRGSIFFFPFLVGNTNILRQTESRY